MSNALALKLKGLSLTEILYDLGALLFIYFTPAISHMISVPVYLADPMRIIILLSIIHTSGKNSYLIALTLPVFSYFISMHPVFLKSLLITSELMLNIFLYFKLAQFIKNNFILMFTSILISKLFYYAVKYLLISNGLLQAELIATPLELQVIVMLSISGYFFLINNKTDSDSEVL